MQPHSNLMLTLLGLMTCLILVSSIPLLPKEHIDEDHASNSSVSDEEIQSLLDTSNLQLDNLEKHIVLDENSFEETVLPENETFHTLNPEHELDHEFRLHDLVTEEPRVSENLTSFPNFWPHNESMEFLGYDSEIVKNSEQLLNQTLNLDKEQEMDKILPHNASVTEEPNTGENQVTDIVDMTPDMSNGTQLVTEATDTTEHDYHHAQSAHHENANAIKSLLGKLLHKLDIPQVLLNNYRYITAMKSNDGSLYVPHNHKQSTRKHLATLLGFAEEIVSSQNALAYIEEVEEKGSENEKPTDKGKVEETLTGAVETQTEEPSHDTVAEDQQNENETSTMGSILIGIVTDSLGPHEQFDNETTVEDAQNNSTTVDDSEITASLSKIQEHALFTTEKTFKGDLLENSTMEELPSVFDSSNETIADQTSIDNTSPMIQADDVNGNQAEEASSESTEMNKLDLHSSPLLDDEEETDLPKLKIIDDESVELKDEDLFDEYEMGKGSEIQKSDQLEDERELADQNDVDHSFGSDEEEHEENEGELVHKDFDEENAR